MKPFLLFDAYGTLLELDDFYTHLQTGFARGVSSHRGQNFPVEVVRHAAHCEMKHYIQHAIRARDETTREALRLECAGILAAAIREQEYSLDWPDEAVQQVLVEAIVFRAFPEVPSVLAELKQRGVEMGVLSNWDFSLPQKLENLDLERYFRFVLTSAQAGAQKPARVFYEQGLSLAQQEYSEARCFYIGDHFENDVLGARAAGLVPIWLVRDRRDLASGETHETKEDVLRIGSLDDLREVLDTN